MGAWEATSFGNDAALDWMSMFAENQDIQMITNALEMVDMDNYIDSDFGSEAIAAAEIVAAILGKPSPDFPSNVNIDFSSLAPKIKDETIQKAVKAVQTVYQSNLSELRELWDGQDEFEESCEDLIGRLAMLDPTI